MPHTAAFFKAPLAGGTHDFYQQFQASWPTPTAVSRPGIGPDASSGARKQGFREDVAEYDRILLVSLDYPSTDRPSPEVAIMKKVLRSTFDPCPGPCRLRARLAGLGRRTGHGRDGLPLHGDFQAIRARVQGKGAGQSLGTRLEVRGGCDASRAHSLGVGHTSGLRLRIVQSVGERLQRADASRRADFRFAVRLRARVSSVRSVRARTRTD
jgi:hypothetical protein